MDPNTMTDNVHPWPKPAGRADAPLPKPIVRPCDWGLLGAINNMETQLGSIEAYNRLAAAAAKLKAKIDAGNAEAQNPIYAVSTGAVEPPPPKAKAPPSGLRCLYCSKPVDDTWTTTEKLRGWRMVPGGKQYHCRDAAVED